MAKLKEAFLELREDVRILASTADENTDIGRETLRTLTALEASISDWLPELAHLSEQRQADLLNSLTALHNSLAEKLQLVSQLIETGTIKVVGGLDKLGHKTLTANIVGAILQNQAQAKVNNPNRKARQNWVFLLNVIIAKHNESQRITIPSLRNTLVSAGVSGEQVDAMLSQLLEHKILLPESDSQGGFVELDTSNPTFEWMVEELDQGRLPVLL